MMMRMFPAAALLVIAAAPAMALECPMAQPGSPGVLTESSSQIAELSALLGSGDLDNRMPDIVAGLRQRHPSAQPAEIVNYLVTAYCPVVAGMAGLDEAGRRARLDRFASEVAVQTMRR